MKVITILIATGLVFAAAGQSTSNDGKKPAPNRVVPTPPNPTIPKDATPLPDGSFRYVDKAGKKWIYRNTPFGVSKAEERIAAPVVQTAPDPIKSEDLGDSVRFSRPTPFGPKVWTVKKTELNEYEKSIWDRDHPKNDNHASKRPSNADDTASQSGDAKSSDTAKKQD